MIRHPLQEILPIPLLPEPESLNLRPRITHRSEPIGSPLKIKIYKLLQVRSNNLVGVHKDDFLEVEREKDVEEEDFVSPDLTLLFLLGTKPVRPFVCYELVLEAVFFGHDGDKVL